MISSFPDSMIFQAIGPGRTITAKQAIDQARTFLMGLEALSPWRRPFDVSGTTAKRSYMPIASDLLDFDELVNLSIKDYNLAYQNSDPKNLALEPNSKSLVGFRTSFSNYTQSRNEGEKTSITIQTSGTSPRFGQSVALVAINGYLSKRNEVWTETNVINSVFDYMIEFFDADKCTVYSSDQNARTRLAGSPSTIGWLNYTTNPRIQAALLNDGRAKNYREGILFRLGEDVSVFSDPKIDEDILNIRQIFLGLGISDWTKK